MNIMMNRRDALKTMALGTAALAVPRWSPAAELTREALASRYPFVLPDLPYAYDALAAYIDPETMNLHHMRHHAAYVNNLNAAIERYPDLHGTTLQDLLANLDALPESIRTTVRNNGGGHANHVLFWEILGTEEGTPEGRLAELIEARFGTPADCLAEWRKASLSVFGSGWSWLSFDGEVLRIETTPNQDTPLMAGRTPLAGVDVWEHAYYLRYQQRRADYVDGVLRHLNWTKIAETLT